MELEYMLISTPSLVGETFAVQYGIKCFWEDKEISIKQISHDKHSVEELVRDLNELQAMPNHLEDIVDDWMGDFSLDIVHP